LNGPLVLALTSPSSQIMTFTRSKTRYVSLTGPNSSPILPAFLTTLTLQLKSRQLPVLLASLAELPPFNPTGVAIMDVAKTGLGSSAALITSLVTALLVQSGLIAPDQLTSAPARRLVHNVAQFVHCLAQGKVGSGFDVSAAVFGSQLYTRFNPAVLQPLMDDSVVCCHFRPDLAACLSLLFLFAVGPAIAPVGLSAGEPGVGCDRDTIHPPTADAPTTR
jgi:ERG8-type phosphomevalonate kinase